jgi:hypothetical protein
LQEKKTEVKRTKRSDFWSEIPISKENQSFFSDHLAELQKDCSCPPSSQDVGKIKQLMQSTYEERRADILTTTIPVQEIVTKYPPLATVTGVSTVCRRVITTTLNIITTALD